MKVSQQELKRRFEELVKLEPRLRTLEVDIKKNAQLAKTAVPYCANRWWYGYGEQNGGFHIRMKQLVGDYVDTVGLNTSKAHDDVFNYLFNLMPDCNHTDDGCGIYTEPTEESLRNEKERRERQERREHENEKNADEYFVRVRIRAAQRKLIRKFRAQFPDGKIPAEAQALVKAALEKAKNTEE